MPIACSIDKIKANTSELFWEQGYLDQRQGRVQSVQIVGKYLEGTVLDSALRTLKIAFQADEIRGTCSCGIEYNCKHVVALLVEGLMKGLLVNERVSSHQVAKNLIATPENRSLALNPKTLPLSYDIKKWLAHVEEDADSLLETSALFFGLRLLVKTEGLALLICPLIGNTLKRGGVGKLKIYENRLHRNRPLKETDGHWLRKLGLFESESLDWQDKYGYRLEGPLGSEVLTGLLGDEKCLWLDEDVTDLAQAAPWGLGEPRSSTFQWTPTPEGHQKLICHVEPACRKLLFLDIPWYVDAATQTMGPVHTGTSPHMLKMLMEMPALAPEETQAAAKVFQEKIQTRPDGAAIPLPHTFRKMARQKLAPQPCLELTMIKVPMNFGRFLDVPGARLAVRYGQTRLAFDDTRQAVFTLDNNVLVSAERDLEQEQHYVRDLLPIGLKEFSTPRFLTSTPAPRFFVLNLAEARQGLTDHHAMAKWLDFMRQTVPTLEAQGWTVDVSPIFPLHRVTDGDWYGDLKDTSDNNWFDLEMGVMIGGEKKPLLPLLLGLLKGRDHVMDRLRLTPADQDILIPLAKGRSLAMPAARVKGILEFLRDLYDTELTPEKALRLSQTDVMAFRAFEEATQGAIQWRGGEELRKLGQTLDQFSTMPSVSPPAAFQATLRGYQRDALNWLQFLRAHGLSGILADDMGLGKTVQTLAHICCEKAEGRLTQPILLIVPTSLVSNWESETARFAPHLRLLTLHGLSRHTKKNAFQEHDIILTTYPLLWRDAEEFLKHTYHMVILDEAQTIKNARTRTTEVAHHLKAHHKLCLTGTPLENHLGELWSLFHFLLPGWLGSAKQFQELYRNPIEKGTPDESYTRRKSLMRRLKPFIMRRTKTEVAADLPPKTEVILKSTFEPDQRDLYETLRVSLHEKVQEEIRKKGFARSHITILEAILKLRQVCCDPRLLPSYRAKEAEGISQDALPRSAKLTQLMEMMPEMLEEGRKILLFSQFTGMLALIEKECQALDIPYVKLTGETQNRREIITAFQAGTVPLFLISLKAGGVGLNLTAADTVIHYDPWWNPSVERQATDRAHRLGQDKPIFVYKMIAEGTIEEKILLMQEKKAGLINALLDNAEASATKLSAEDLKILFEPDPV